YSAVMVDFGKRDLLAVATKYPKSLVRVALTIDKLDEALSHIRKLVLDGKMPPFTINIMRMSTLTHYDLGYIGAKVSENLAGMSALHAVYLADSYGACLPDNVEYSFQILRSAISRGSVIPLGFHGHDNLTLAFANSLAAIRGGATWI